MNARSKPRRSHGRQRQRLIDACISALHIHGPSRTTVEKVVAIAKMSPGIVRFYFDSKAAMLLASLQFLADEFDERLLGPVSSLRSTPVAALQLMVELYLDSEIASPRKVSVWYSFWGEASSRQEYYDICGQKDEGFAALVRDLIERLIIESHQPELDADGIALGLIGVLEMLWQDFAFRTERNIDRPAAKRRCMAYLRSVFPNHFRAAPSDLVMPPPPRSVGRLAALAYSDPSLIAVERAAVFPGNWTVVGHESQVSRPGEFLTLDIGVERVLVVSDAAGALHAWRNSCPASAHALVSSRSGRFAADIECGLHGLRFSWDGRNADGHGSGLQSLVLENAGGLLWVTRERRSPLRIAFDPPHGLTLLDSPMELSVAANWKVLVEQWLESCASDSNPAGVPAPERESLTWSPEPLRLRAWSARRYEALVKDPPQPSWRRQFLPPNQLLEFRPDGLSVLQAIPTGPERSLLRRMDFSLLSPPLRGRAVLYLAQRLGPYARRAALRLAESTQQGMVSFGYEASAAPWVAWFRELLVARVPALAARPTPTDRAKN